MNGFVNVVTGCKHYEFMLVLDAKLNKLLLLKTIIKTILNKYLIAFTGGRSQKLLLSSSRRPEVQFIFMGKFTYSKNEIRTTVYGHRSRKNIIGGKSNADPSFTQKVPKETNWKANSSLVSTTEEEVSEQ